ncbi:uncharacterized protein EV420DRAFT_1582217 [Desarmillaria tabescens]|uniref:Cytochrome P450 n=1 Tax=Armillaria tabescens TaxID=1929756 RepID=A0AA39MNH5_ARMTA|nr:uncharacterized protein EV420DRAFT_1582217 [Desarmillaria tabescens]KAK0440209.1 hypothetical protein EV420DRAFT_1582217 [Desarmillaria tabescens]
MAFVYECYRWRPLVPNGIAHAANQDFIWISYVIPKGATIVASPWSIFRSPDIFPDPEKIERRYKAIRLWFWSKSLSRSTHCKQVTVH